MLDIYAYADPSNFPEALMGTVSNTPNKVERAVQPIEDQCRFSNIRPNTE